MAKLLWWNEHTLEIFMWSQNYGYVFADEDPFMKLPPKVRKIFYWMAQAMKADWEIWNSFGSLGMRDRKEN